MSDDGSLGFVVAAFGALRCRRIRGLAADDVVEFVANDVVMDVELVKNLGCDVVVVPQERYKEMFRSDDVGFIKLGFEIGDLEDLLGLLGERDVADRQRSAGGAHRVLDRFLQFIEIDSEVPEDLYGDSLPLADDAEQQMFSAD